MKIRRLGLAIGLAIVALTSAAFALPNIGNLIGGAGVLAAVKEFGPGINRAVNDVTGNHHLKSREATKVVPIVSVGDGAAVGAAQVTGPSSAVAKVAAVAQIELNYKEVARGKALIPVTSTNPAKFHRVEGVGVTAVIDVRLSL
jgi:hypothetical protein